MTIPTTIGKYSITREIGRGAMGMIYEGFDPTIERRVAIKTILPEYLHGDGNDDAAERFRREAQASGRLSHPSIVQVYEYSEARDGAAYIVMEYAEGISLKQLIKQRARLEIADVFLIMKQLLGALAYSHKQGVIHRDIKPANIMVTPDLGLKLMDFGIARIGVSGMTQVGMMVGTPAYAAPEQIRGLDVDARTDLWACGVVLYELLTKTNPFAAGSFEAMMNNVLTMTPYPPSTLRPGLPAALDYFVGLALSKRASDRFANANEFLRELMSALSGKPTSVSTDKTTVSANASLAASLPTAASRSLGVQLPPECLQVIDQAMAKHIGPLGPVVVRRTLATSSSEQQFFDTLADTFTDGEARASFLRVARRLQSNGGTSATSTGGTPNVGTDSRLHSSTRQNATTTLGGLTLSSDELSVAERRLATYVGPLAKLLIRRAANESGTIPAFYQKLAANIDRLEDRRRFLESVERAG
jgi:eukaryotic-like serine/threonine-protein kinase